MKLRKQARAKAAIVALTAALLFGFFALVRSEPRARAAPEATPTPFVDYRRFFVPTAPEVPTPVPETRPHTRTRAS